MSTLAQVPSSVHAIMKKNYTSYQLIDGGGATPRLIKQTDITFQEVRDNLIARDSSVMVASGFSELSPESVVPLSPALQLNGDLSNLGDELLQQFAEAERVRKNSTSYTSHTFEPEKRICAISDNAESLQRFLDTYAGVLEIVPLLIKGSNAEFEDVSELSIEVGESGFSITYSTRSPVHYSRCTYCGVCGPACPEKCISESLFFDYDACSFCRECEKLCPENAIDIYAVEEKVLEIPAVIALGSTQVQVPEGTRSFYHESELATYFSTLFPTQVDQVITCDHSKCQFSNRSKQGCSECVQACNYGAISTTDTIAIDSFKCVECGKCASVCPTGAIQYLRFEDNSFIEFFRTFPLEKNSIVVIGAEEELHSLWWKYSAADFGDHLFLEYPRVTALSSFHLLFLLAHGASHVIVVAPGSVLPPTLHNLVAMVNDCLKELFDFPRRVWATSVKDVLSLDVERDNKTLRDSVFNDLNYVNRRQYLTALISFCLAGEEREIVLENEPGSLFSSVLCDDKACTQCLACLNECKIEALTADPTALTLSWTGSLCTGCNACIDVCPEDALRSGENVTLDSAYFQPAIVAQAEPMRCKECGKVFGTRKSFDRVMQILAEKNMAHDGHFEYCEDCRVLKLFDSE